MHGPQSETLYIEDDLTEDLTYNGSVVIEGDIAPGVTLTVEEGSVTVDGDVQDGASIIQWSCNNHAYEHKVEVTGQTLPNARIEATSAVEVKGIVGASNTIISDNEVSAAALSNDSEILAGYTVTIAGDTASGSKIQSRDTVAVSGAIGAYAEINADQSIQAGNVGFGAKLTAEKDIQCGNVAPSAELRAGGAVNAGFVSNKASIEAKGAVSQKGQAADSGFAQGRE